MVINWLPSSLSLVATVVLVLSVCDDGERRDRREGAGTPGEGAPATDASREAPDRGDREATGTCSAGSLDPRLPAQPGLPEPIARMREEIARAAVACDYARLDSLALAGRPEFSFSFGDGDRPSGYWSSLEASGEAVLGMLVRTLELPYARESYDSEPLALYIWPSAAREDATGLDWLPLERLYSDDEIASFITYGSFIGWRVGIAEDGDWRFFVAGD